MINDFLTHLDNLFKHIKFIIEVEEYKKLPILDLLLTKKENGKLEHHVYRKKTHT